MNPRRSNNKMKTRLPLGPASPGQERHGPGSSLDKGKVRERLHRGLVIVLTGNGRGKTASALGQALRAIGHGSKVCMIQFVKGRKHGEKLAAECVLPGLTIHQCGLDSIVMKDHPAPLDVEMADEGLALAEQIVFSGEWDMVILDEINLALDFKLIPLVDVIDLIKRKPPHLDLILTGRNAPPEIIELSDTVSEIHEAKGISADMGKER